MNRKTKIMAFIMTIVLCFSVFISVNANTDNKPVIKGETVKVIAGETADVTFLLENNPGVTAIVTDYEYDSSVLTLTNTKDEGLLSGASFTTSQSLTDNPFRTIWTIGTSNSIENGKLLTLSFKVDDNAKPGMYEIKVSYNEDDIYNTQLDNVKFETVSGYVVVEETQSAEPVETPLPTVSEVPSVEPTKDTQPTGTPVSDVKNTDTPQPVETTTPDVENTSTPQPVETTTPDVENTGTPQPVETATPDVENTDTPQHSETQTPDADITGKQLKGDSNNDGKVDLQDAQFVLQVALGIRVVPENVMLDMDDNGKINLEDAVLVLKVALGICNL